MSHPSLELEKKRARAKFRARRSRLFASDRDRAQESAASHALELLESHSVRTVALFAATAEELGTEVLFRKIRARSMTAVFPRVVGKDLVFSIVHRWEDLSPGAFKVLEPKAFNPPISIDAMVVPALALDLFGGRLGQGGGYYDRWLSRNPRPKCVIGYVFDVQVVERLPVDRALDQVVDAIVTERRIIRL